MSMNEKFLHFHLQLVTLCKNSDLWLNFLYFQFADSSRFCTLAQQTRKLVTWRTSHKKFRLFSILHSSEFCFVIFITALAFAVVKSTAKPSRSLNDVAHDANFDGLSVAVVSHAFNSINSNQNSMTSSSLRFSTMHSGLSDSSIFSNTSVFTNLFMDCSLASSNTSTCSGAVSAASATTSSTLHVLCAGTSQHLHQDVVLPPSLPIVPHLHLAFSGLGFP